MALNDRVIVGNGSTWKENGESVMAYMPKIDQAGQMIVTPDGATVVGGVGGVKVGSSGVINGPVIQVHRSHIHDGSDYRAPGIGNKDFVALVPVFLDRYQRVGYFPVDQVRLFGSYGN